MIHLNYSLTKKDYKKYYFQVMTIYYMRLFLITLGLGMIITGAIRMFSKQEELASVGISLLATYFPSLILCLVLSVFLSFFELRKIEKEHPETMEGEFKVRFEKNFIIWQIEGKNNKLTYNPYRLYKGFKNTVILQHLHEKKHIVIPEDLLTQEQIKTINASIRG